MTTAVESLAPLEGATDWRVPERRREAFHDFYEFHTRFGIHPGCVYFVIPYLRRELGWDDEQAFWFAFINGNTQNPITSLMLHRQGSRPAEAKPMLQWWLRNVRNLAWDTDRRYHRQAFPDSVRGYLTLLDKRPQADFWQEASLHGFANLWNTVTDIPTFGRLSAWSMCDYLHICGVDIGINTLMLPDQAGSRSHRNGLCIVAGLDAYDWHQSNPGFNGHYPRKLLRRLAALGKKLLAEAQERAAGKPWARDVNYLTLESALCTYKSWHRPNRRYPGVYVDMMHDRIRQAEDRFRDADFTSLWNAREACLPSYLVQELSGDPGLTQLKQNHYRLTGEVPIMGHTFPKYWSAYDELMRGDRDAA